jgi:hypothetical protein
MTQKLFLALACCLVLFLIPASQASAQTQPNDAYSWRDANGNLHYQDEDGNYFINSGTSSTDIQSDLDTTAVEREKPSEPQTQSDVTQDINRDTSVDSSADTTALNADADLPRTAGELPLLGLFGVLSLVGSRAVRFAWNTRR